MDYESGSNWSQQCRQEHGPRNESHKWYDLASSELVFGNEEKHLQEQGLELRSTNIYQYKAYEVKCVILEPKLLKGRVH